MRNSGSNLVDRLRQVLLLGVFGITSVTATAQTPPAKPVNPDTYNQDVLPTGGVPGQTATVSSLDLKWMEKTQMNLMRPGLGTTVVSGPTKMVNEDPTMTTDLPAGKTSPVIKFKNPQIITSFVFFNFLGSGTVTVSGALTDAGAPAWKVLAQGVSFNGPGPITIPLSTAEVRMVRLDFETAGGASIASVSLYGEMRMSDFITQIDSNGAGNNRPQTTINPNDKVDQTRESINVAYNQWGARMIYVSSGDTTPETLRFQNDYNPATVFQFAPEDPKPTEILRLPQVIPLKRIAMLLEAPVGRIDIYLLRDLPDDLSKLVYDGDGKPPKEKVPEAQARAAFEKVFKERSPKATTFTKKGPNRLELGFLPADCRYMLITFTPGATSGGVTALLEPQAVHYSTLASPLTNLLWSPFAQSEGTSFTVSEVAAFGFLTENDLFDLPADDTRPPGAGDLPEGPGNEPTGGPITPPPPPPVVTP